MHGCFLGMGYCHLAKNDHLLLLKRHSMGRMIHRLLDDNRQMAEAQRAAIEVCEDNRDTPTANLLQEILNETEKRIWFLHEICQGIAAPPESTH